MNIRRAISSDAAALAAIEKTQPRAARWGEKGFAAELEQSYATIWCVEIAGEMAGFIAVRAVIDSAEILNVAVHSQYVRKGLGTALMTFVLKELTSQGVCSVSLEVAQDNQPALALYTKAGFVKCNVRRDFYAPGQNGWVLRKEL